MIRYLDRSQWGARNIPRLGPPVARAVWAEVVIHHTATPRPGPVPNEWDSLDDMKRMMQHLQVVRPDLGRDIPYNFVAFCRSNGELVLCEGRGLDRRGAHTAGRNSRALGIAVAGNFELAPLPAFFDRQLHYIGAWLWRVRRTMGVVNIGGTRPFARDVWGHRDIRDTLCPGAHLYQRLDIIRFLDEENAMDQPTWQLVQAGLQALDPPLYDGRPVDGLPGANTNTAVRAFEERLGLTPHGVIGTFNEPTASMWPPTREMLFAAVYSPWTEEHEHEVQVSASALIPDVDVHIGRVRRT